MADLGLIPGSGHQIFRWLRHTADASGRSVFRNYLVILSEKQSKKIAVSSPGILD